MPVDPARVEIAAVRPEQHDAVRAFLRSCALPEAGLDGHWSTAWTAVDPDSGDILGTVALEVHGESALLRSLAAREDWRSRGLGSALFDFAISQARDRGLDSVGLLTTTAAPFFARRGFAPVSWDAMPSSLGASAEFQGACPSSAQAMIFRLR